MYSDILYCIWLCKYILDKNGHEQMQPTDNLFDKYWNLTVFTVQQSHLSFKEEVKNWKAVILLTVKSLWHIERDFIQICLMVYFQHIDPNLQLTPPFWQRGYSCADWLKICFLFLIFLKYYMKYKNNTNLIRIEI